MVRKEAVKQNYFRSITFMQIQVCNRHEWNSNLNFLAQFPSVLSHQAKGFAFKWELENSLYTKNDRTIFTTQKTTMQLCLWDSSSICFFSLSSDRYLLCLSWSISSSLRLFPLPLHPPPHMPTFYVLYHIPGYTLDSSNGTYAPASKPKRLPCPYRQNYLLNYSRWLFTFNCFQ